MEFKVKCTRNKDYNFTVGRIYTWKDGKMKDDTGYIYWSSCPNSDVKAWKFCGTSFECFPDIKVGDTVRATEDYYNDTKGKIGKVVGIAIRAFVDFGNDFKGHDGNGVFPKRHPTNTCWFIPIECLELVTPAECSQIVITTDGKTTTAKRYEGNCVVQEATAKCAPDDTFDFDKGARLAFDRLMEQTLVQQDKVFVPHMEYKGAHYGNLGKPTKYEDFFGSPLRVGDTVDLISKSGNKCGERVIVHRINVMGTSKTFVMGIEDDCDEHTGIISGGWKIVLKHRFEDIPDGNFVCVFKYIKTKSK